ncbi:MAG TPA: hypothetical protein VD969_09370 [Symbiobacteriaceae bacterium]|nr:hypothetical protein [Symbiobacteriaceae bacterium]
MFSPWQMQQMRQARPLQVTIVPLGRAPLMETASGGFPVPQSMTAEMFPPAVRESILRLFQGPPKPSVSLNVMNQTQASMIAPDLPNRANV